MKSVVRNRRHPGERCPQDGTRLSPLEPPRLRTLEDGDDRRATWLELFFDLVFVVAVGQLAYDLSAHPSLTGLGRFVALFVPVWWAWMGFTFYANRFDTDDLAYRLLTLAGMFAVAALATTVRGAFIGGSAGFAIAYVCVRLVLLVLYARARRHVESARALSTVYSAVFSVGVAIWLASLLVGPPVRYAFWAVALAIELAAPIFGWRLIPKAPIDPRHIPERFGLLTLIVLGESVLAVVVGVTDVSWTIGSALAAAGGFVAAASIWWLYFGFVDSATAGRGLLGGFVYLYAHFPIVVGIAALGSGVKVAVLSSGDARLEDTGWVMCTGLGLCMAGMGAIDLVTPPAVLDTDVWLRLATAVWAIALIPLSFVLPPLAIVWLLAGALAAQVVVELAAHEEGHTVPSATP